MNICTPATKNHSKICPLKALFHSIKNTTRSASYAGSKSNFSDHHLKENTGTSFIPLHFVQTTPKRKKNSKISIEIPNTYIPPVYGVDSKRRKYLKSARRRYSAISTPNEPQKCIALINLFPESEIKSNKKPRTNGNSLIISYRIKKANNSLYRVNNLSYRNSSCSPMLIENYKSASQKAMYNMDEESEYKNQHAHKLSLPEDKTDKMHSLEYMIIKSIVGSPKDKNQTLSTLFPQEDNSDKMYNFEYDILDDSPNRIVAPSLKLS